MHRSEFAKMVATKVGLPVRQVELLFAAIEDATIEALRLEGEVLAVGGKFSVVAMKARLGVNPQTGEKIKISARTVVRVKPNTTLKKAFAPKKVTAPRVDPKPKAKARRS